MINFKNIFKSKRLTVEVKKPSIDLGRCQITFAYDPITLELSVVDFECDLCDFKNKKMPKIWENGVLRMKYHDLIITTKPYPDKQNMYYAARNFINAVDNIVDKRNIHHPKQIFIERLTTIFNGNEHALKSILKGIEMVMNDTVEFKKSNAEMIKDIIPITTSVQDWEVEYKLTDDEYEKIVKQILR
jgi:hypothetical protein